MGATFAKLPYMIESKLEIASDHVVSFGSKGG
jgi:hypothetical protein